MTTSVSMPQLGESVTEGTISRWLKQEGEFVAKDEPLVEIITDKVTAEMPSPFEGMILKITAPEGTAVEVGQEIAVIQEVGSKTDGTEEIKHKPAQVAQQVAATGVSEPATAVRAALVEENGNKRATPMVRRLAREYGIDLAVISGTGINGRVTKDDIENYLAHKVASQPVIVDKPQISMPTPAPTGSTAVATPDRPAATPVESAPAPQDEQILELTPMRRAIAEHMVRSKHTSPHALTVIEVNMTNIVKWRESIKSEFRRREGIDLTYVPFVMKATVEALKANPTVNSSWTDDKIVLRKEINLGVAVAVDNGLVVPVVRNADERSIAGLARAVADLADRARSNKLTLADIQGGTFTVNNTGSYGSIISMPIINQPQAAILSMEAIQKRPVVIDDAIAIRSMMYLCLSFDHRIIDGALAGRFLQRIRAWLESFGPTTPLY